MNGKEERLGDWMQTYTGCAYWPQDPRVGDVHLMDIAHHLSMICRFTGGVSRFYSVAEHSVHASYVVSAPHALTALMHDAPEAYLADINAPLKRTPQMKGYRDLESLNWLVISEKFGLPYEMPQEVHDADVAMYVAEHAVLMRPYPLPAGPYDTPYVVPLGRIAGWSPAFAEHRFLNRFMELTDAK